MMQRPQGVLSRQRDEYRKLTSKLERYTEQASGAVSHGASPEHLELACSDPGRKAPSQLLLSRNGVGKTTVVNHLLMLGEQDTGPSRDQAPKRLEQTEQGRSRVLVPVSEAAAEVLGENDLLCDSSGTIQYICNRRADVDLDQHEQEEADLTFKPIRDFVHVGPPEAHMEARSFLLTTGCQTGTTTNSTLQVQHGHIPGALEKFKSRQQLQEDAFKYVQLTDRDNPNQEQSRKLYERYKLITGQTNHEPLPVNLDEVPIRSDLEDVAGKTRLYSGHNESLLSFRCFLRGKLTANQPFSPVHVALDSTTVYWPSSSVVVPIIDTPGTGDGNILNEAATQAAVDEAIENGSQLLICGTKSLAAEATLTPFVVQYMQYMIVNTQDTPCIRGVLLPETSGQRYTHKAVCSDHEERTRQEKIRASLEQLQKWMQQANEQLPAHQRAQPDRLSALLQRFEVRVAYMHLFASLCLQPHSGLRELACEAGTVERPVEVSVLLASWFGSDTVA